MKELIRVQSVPSYNEFHTIHIPHKIYVIDFIGNNVLASLIKKEFIGLKSLKEIRAIKGWNLSREDRDGVEFNLNNSQLDSEANCFSIMSEDAYCNEEILRIYAVGYSPDKISYYAEQILKESPFDSLKMYIGNIKSLLNKEEESFYKKLII